LPPATASAAGSATSAEPEVRAAPQAPALEEIVVHASHYRLARASVAAHATLDASDLELLPEVGDDALRTVARLPGMASSDLTAKVNVRGGVADETLVRFDDLRLYNPFHLKDFQSPFSAIDPRLIRDIDAYAGGFPVRFGDRMSGVLDIASIVPLEQTRREISLSFFNLSALAAGAFDDDAGDWLVAGRRGNIDLVIDALDPDLGRPRYTELHGHVAHSLGPALDVAANVLRHEDDILLYDSDQEESARATYRDTYYWLRFDHRPSQRWSGTWLLSRSRIESLRSGSADLPGVSRGTLRDEHDARIDAIQADWTWDAAAGALVRFGAEWRHMQADYQYADEAEFDLLIVAPGAESRPQRERVVQARPRGDVFGMYASLRVEPLSDLYVEGGLRWDRQTLSSDGSDSFSPRVSLSYRLYERTTLRAGWGRFVQPQDVTELQVSDGVDRFAAPQRAQHFLAGLEHEFGVGWALRVEAYRKTYDRLRPRFENLLNTFVLLPELKPDRVKIAPDRATATGLELSLRGRGGDALDWWIAYAWSRSQDLEAGVETARSWDTTHLISGALTWQPDPWSFSLAARYHSGWPTTALALIESEPMPIAVAGPRNAGRLRPYLSIDARIAREFRFESAGTLIVYAEVTNLLNRANDCCVEYEIEDENEGLVLDVGRLDSLPTVPSLGFIWQF
jgi:outer membrane receptor protein involved in Fe transport